MRQAVSNLLAGARRLLQDRIILVLTIMFCMGVAAMLWRVSHLQSTMITSIALQDAALYSQALAEFRTLYTSEVVENVLDHGIEVTHDYATKSGAIPLPATLTLLLGERISAHESGEQVRLYSPHPFPFRPQGGLRDAFEQEAWSTLRQSPDQSFYRIEEHQGRRLLRYATADRMRPSCVACHNAHPQSPKTGWQTGDVRGVLEVALPLHKITAQARADMQGTFAIVGSISVLGLAGLILAIRRLQRTSIELEQNNRQLLEHAETQLGLVQQVQQSGIQVTTSATQLAASSKQLEAMMTEQVASTHQVMTTARGISTTSQDFLGTMNEVTSLAEEAAAAAAGSQSGLSQMETAMQQMEEATGAIATRLAVIKERAANITSVVTTISKVADQTNLLSLNAAIEAEKAGEYGRGFTVVAREIRRLADQTAVGTLDIEHMVREMTAAVTSGVMGIDQFAHEVRQGVQDVRTVGNQLTEIIAQVQALTPRFEAVHAGMQTQVQGAQQISEAMNQLNEAAQQTAMSLQDSAQAIEQLHEATQGLQDGIRRVNIQA